jgi:arginyl-tRNA synthetase
MGFGVIVSDSIKKAVKDLELTFSDEMHLEHPGELEHGDYATNVAMKLKSKRGKRKATTKNLKLDNPREIAEDIVGELKKDKELGKVVEKSEVAGPGFINFWLKSDKLVKELGEINKKKENYGKGEWGKGKTAIVDYSAPNIAKRFSIGHLRSTIIGQAIYNLYKFSGWKVIGDNHLGDWGTQFGKMIVAIGKWAKKPTSKLSIDEMEKLYVEFHKKAEEDSDLDEEARQAFKALEEGSKEEYKIWEQLVKSSMREFQALYNLLGVKIDVAHGESFYEEIMPGVIEEAKKKEVARQSEGAWVIEFPGDSLPPAMLLKSDGATTYLTRDLATIKFRKEKWKPNLAIYEVGAEQKVHFEQVFWAAELLGIGKRSEFVHVPHGLIRLKEGKMSTRKGKVIKLEAVLEEAVKRAEEFNDDKAIAKAVGIGAVKYNDLRRAPTTGYVFNWDEVLNLDGNSGPYLQYTYARCRSVLRKSEVKNQKSKVSLEAGNFNNEETSVLRWIYRFPEVIEEAARSYSPNLVCNFLYELAQRYNTFYNSHSILGLSASRIQNTESRTQNETNQETIDFRLLLTKATAQVLKNGLTLLGIEAPERM